MKKLLFIFLLISIFSTSFAKNVMPENEIKYADHYYSEKLYPLALLFYVNFFQQGGEGDVKAVMRLIDCLYYTNHYEHAMKLTQTILNDNPQNLVILRIIMRSQNNLGNYENAYETAQELLKNKQRCNAQDYLFYANILAHLGRKEEAKGYYEQAADLDENIKRNESSILESINSGKEIDCLEKGKIEFTNTLDIFYDDIKVNSLKKGSSTYLIPMESKLERIPLSIADIEDKPFVSVENMPKFPGGSKELKKFIDSNLNKIENKKGRVIIRFTVLKNGEIAKPEIQRGLSPLHDEEALRVVRAMPTWIPGKQNGEPVNVHFTIPIIFD